MEHANLFAWTPGAEEQIEEEEEEEEVLGSDRDFSDSLEEVVQTTRRAPKSDGLTIAQHAAGISAYSVVYSVVLANAAMQRFMHSLLWMIAYWASSPVRLLAVCVFSLRERTSMRATTTLCRSRSNPLAHFALDIPLKGAKHHYRQPRRLL